MIQCGVVCFPDGSADKWDYWLKLLSWPAVWLRMLFGCVIWHNGWYRDCTHFSLTLSLQRGEESIRFPEFRQVWLATDSYMERQDKREEMSGSNGNSEGGTWEGRQCFQKHDVWINLDYFWIKIIQHKEVFVYIKTTWIALSSLSGILCQKIFLTSVMAQCTECYFFIYSILWIERMALLWR